MNESLSREEQLFDAARQLADPMQRHAYLAQACDGDDPLRTRMESLLAAEPVAEDLFHEGQKALQSSAEELGFSLSANNADGASEESPGAHLGPYRILNKTGEGGCGVVYLAEQEQPVRRRVAIKVIKLGMDTRAVVARFNAERQALAMMDHPNIAKVFEAGATASGRPYFVMEFVGGVKITEFCDKACLGMKARLELFAHVCHAIQHAHQKGVVHRDIKPSNILVAWVDGQPAPKVIDFGVAKATEEPLTEKTIFTPHTQVIGTPAYMSPEQAGMDGLDVDTRSDIYSLGALLYELLTSKTPFDGKKLWQSGVEEMRRALREQEPPAPSAALASFSPDELAAAAQRRQLDPSRFAAGLRDELDCIALKALEKDRGRRYQAANDMALDVQRYLVNEPIAARPPTRMYRFEKLVRRNKGLFAAIGAIAAILILALASSVWLWQREIQARRRAVAAEQKEAQLRHEAETREEITHAATLFNNQRRAEAEALIDGIELRGPTVEGAAVLRGLGEWHVLAGQWARAAGRFRELTSIDQADGWDVASIDFLESGVALVEAGDLSGYRRFHQACLDRFSGATNLIVAERMVKINLLAPADGFDIRRLQPWALAGAQPTELSWSAAWRAVSLALYEYRLGNDEAALAWGRQAASSSPPNPSRQATAEVINAVILRRLGQSQEAARSLQQGRMAIEHAFNVGLVQGNGDIGFWFDWVFARILLREASPTGVPVSRVSM